MYAKNQFQRQICEYTSEYADVKNARGGANAKYGQLHSGLEDVRAASHHKSMRDVYERVKFENSFFR